MKRVEAYRGIAAITLLAGAIIGWLSGQPTADCVAIAILGIIILP